MWKVILRFARALSESADKTPVLPSFPVGNVALALLTHLTNHYKGLVQSITDQQLSDAEVSAPASSPPLKVFPTAFKLVRFFLAHLTNFLKQCGPLLLLPRPSGMSCGVASAKTSSEGGTPFNSQGSGKRIFAHPDDPLHQIDSNVSFSGDKMCIFFPLCVV